jgi:hypothetical protein
MAVVYGWSQRGLSYFISTGGSTELHDKKYLSSFDDNFGNIVYKEINCPKFVHFLYDNLPLTDKENKKRQSVLNLENCWSLRLLVQTFDHTDCDVHRGHAPMTPA